MEEKLKELFMSKIQACGKTEVDVSSYTIIRSGTGLFTFKIYWKGKAMKKSDVSINIKLNNDIEAMFSGTKAIESIIEDGTKADIDFGQKVRSTKGNGW